MIRLAPDGGEEWNRTYGGEEADTAHAIIRTNVGNLLLAGNLTLVTNGTRADTDAWLVEIDPPSGGEVWNRTYGGPDVNATAAAAIEAEDGGATSSSVLSGRGRGGTNPRPGWSG
ncbi:hypothetical protein [Methanoculleus chikugoensis]|uniref:hypothetical protein n=1 Tax=Methanoculleus chikugoensis TaxID=118126 RepID=UPI0006D2047F|nr:hypothetical protein [Methanoculleus chikugoensis]